MTDYPTQIQSFYCLFTESMSGTNAFARPNKAKCCYTQNLMNLLSCYMESSKLRYGFLKVVTWICLCISRLLPNKTKLKFNQDFKACWSFCSELMVRVLNALGLSCLWQCFYNVIWAPDLKNPCSFLMTKSLSQRAPNGGDPFFLHIKDEDYVNIFTC